MIRVLLLCSMLLIAATIIEAVEEGFCSGVDKSRCWPYSTSCVNTCPAEVNCSSTQTCEHGECVTIATGSYCMDITAIEIVDYTIIGTNNDTTELRCSLDKANYTYTSTAHLNNDRYDCKVGSNRYTASGILSCTYKEAQAHTACDIIYQQCSSIGGNIWGNTRCRWNVNQGSCCYVLKDRITGYWEKKHEGSCKWGCLGEAFLPIEACKSCSCANNESGVGGYSSLC